MNRLDDRVARKVAQKAVAKVDASQRHMSVMHSMYQLLGDTAGRFCRTEREALKLAQSQLQRAKKHTLMAKVAHSPGEYVYLSVVLLRTGEFDFAHNNDPTNLDRGLNLIYMNMPVGVPLGDPDLERPVLLAHLSKHCIERVFKRIGSMSFPSLEAEIRSGLQGFYLMTGLAHAFPDMKQVWIPTKRGVFIGVVRREEDAFTLDIITYLSREALSDRWQEATRFIDGVMASKLLTTIQANHFGQLPQEFVYQISLIASGERLDRIRTYLNEEALGGEDPLGIFAFHDSIHEFMRTRRWTTQGYSSQQHDYLEAAWASKEIEG